jgi:hypothetical protein
MHFPGRTQGIFLEMKGNYSEEERRRSISCKGSRYCHGLCQHMQPLLALIEKEDPARELFADAERNVCLASSTCGF